jgi:TrmH family RNA methyltransferase
MILTITSVQNPRVKAALRLRDRGARDALQCTLIEGPRELARAVAAGVELVELFLCREFCRPEVEPLLQQLVQSRISLYQVTPRVYEKLAYGDRREGIVAVARIPQRNLSNLRLSDAPLVAVLEGTEKPGNVGAVLRTADAAGIDAVILAGGVTDLYNPNAIRASQGALFCVPVCAAGSAETRNWLRERQCAVFAARVDGAMPYTAVSYRGAAAIVLGSEAAGLSDVWRGEDVTSIVLPMRGAVDSLNVSTTAGVLFYEALRQRTT